MRDYFGEYLARSGVRPPALKGRLGEDLTVIYQAPLKTHLFWSVALVGVSFASWKAGVLNSKMKELKKSGSRKS